MGSFAQNYSYSQFFQLLFLPIPSFGQYIFLSMKSFHSFPKQARTANSQSDPPHLARLPFILNPKNLLIHHPSLNLSNPH